MFENTKRLLEWNVTAYRAEKGIWPRTATELADFSRRCGHDLDFGPFHTLHFKPETQDVLHVECVFTPDGDGWAESETLRLEADERADGLIWKARYIWGTLRRVEAIRLCERSPLYRSAV
jgi:hypothetical protein